MICDRCGRLLNRATGRCVCDDYGGNAPPPVALTHPPPDAPPAEGPVPDWLEVPDAVPPAPAPASPASYLPAGLARPSPTGSAPTGPPAAPTRPRPPARPDDPFAAPSPPARPGPSAGAPAAPGASVGPPGPSPSRPASPAGVAEAAPRARVGAPGPPHAGPASPVAPSRAGAAAAPAPRSVSAAAAFAVLDVHDRPPSRKAPDRPDAPPPPVEAPPPAAPERVAGAALGTIAGVRCGRRRFDAVAYEGCVVLARRPRSKAAWASRGSMTAAQLANVHPDNRLLVETAVEDVAVREDLVGGKARFKLRSGQSVALSWWGPPNRAVDAERLLQEAFPGRVDQSSPEVAARLARGLGGLAAAVALVMALVTFVPGLLESEPPPPPPPPPPTTLPPAEQAVRAEVAATCGPFTDLVAALPPGGRPAPASLAGPTSAMRPAFDNAAAALPAWAPARDELAYLQDFARRPADAALRESVSRIGYAVRTVSAACAKAAGSQ